MVTSRPLQPFPVAAALQSRSPFTPHSSRKSTMPYRPVSAGPWNHLEQTLIKQFGVIHKPSKSKRSILVNIARRPNPIGKNPDNRRQALR